jgi:eukaryotic-like serine/threonine-protein kinase
MSVPETNGIFAEHYLLKERLSPGLVEEVWKAEDWTANGAPVTVRLYTPHVRLDPHSLEMLQREQEQRSLLQHPHLLVPASFGVYDGIPYEVAPLQPQQTLAQRLLQQGPIPERDLALLIAHVAGALDFMQAQQPPEAHRQINPDNLLLDSAGNYLLAVPALSTQLRTLLHRATATNLTHGTAYAAPELFGPHPKHTGATDIFALGATLYELCTGEAPWLGGGGLSLSQGAEVPVVPAPYSRMLSNLVRACLHPTPDKRPSARTLAEEATYYLEHGNWKPYGAFGSVTAESIVYKQRSYFWPVLLGVVLVLAALGAAYYFLVWENGGVLADKPDDDKGTVAAVQAPIPATDTIGTDSLPQANEQTQTEEKPEPRAATAKPAPAEPQRSVPAAQPTKTAPATSRAAQPVYPQPTNLDGYLNGLLNTEIPLRVRESWRSAFRKYFSPEAIVSVRMHGATLGNFGVNEFIDILMSTDGNNGVVVDKVLRDNEENTIDELNISIIPIE